MYLGADVDLNAGVAPIGSAGGDVWAGFRFREPAVSVEVGLRGLGSLAAAQTLYPGSSVYVPYRWAYVSGVAAVVVHRGPLFVGPLLEVGGLTQHTDDPRSELTVGPPLVVGVGVRVGAETSLADGVTVRSLVEGEGLAVTAPFIDHNSRSLRSVPPFSSTVAIGLSLHLGWPGERSR